VKFKNKVVLVTGGGTGLGRTMGHQFAREGAAVIVNYSKSKECAKEVVARIDAEGGQAAAIQADVSRDQQARQLIEKKNSPRAARCFRRHRRSGRLPGR
jgi:3-oxoacyl-[acyl-carrier protein] reductase